MNNETPARDTSARRFAKQIADRLETARVGHELDPLALVAEPHRLGLWREALPPGNRGAGRWHAQKGLGARVRQASAHLSGVSQIYIWLCRTEKDDARRDGAC